MQRGGFFQRRAGRHEDPCELLWNWSERHCGATEGQREVRWVPHHTRPRESAESSAWVSTYTKCSRGRLHIWTASERTSLNSSQSSVIIWSFTSSFIRSLLLVIHYPRRSQGRRHRHTKQEHADCHSCRLSFSDCSKHGVHDTTRSLHNWIATLRKMSSDKSHLVQLIAATFHVILLSLKFQVHPSYTLKNSPCSELFCQPRRTATPWQQLQV